MGRLTPTDFQHVAAAVKRAEANTAAEIAVMVKGAADDYVAVRGPLALGFSVVMLTGALFLFPGLPAFDAAVLQCALALLGYALTSPLVRFLVPDRILSLAVEEAAHACFSRLGVHHTAGRNGVLVFVGERERRVHLLADRAAFQVLGQPRLDALAQDVARAMGRGHGTQGLVAAVDALGTLLAGPLPRASDDANEVPDVSSRP